MMLRVYPEYAEGGYADRRTVLQGADITFYLASALSCFPARILQAVGKPGTAAHFRLVMDLGEMCGNSPDIWCSPQWGCQWKPTYTLTVPVEWPSGYYILQFPAQRGPKQRQVDFIVAEREPAGRVLFLVDFLTAQAYNVYGGQSLYGGFVLSGAWVAALKATQVSFRRPLLQSPSYADADRIADPMWTPHAEEPFRAWLADRFKVAYLSNDALEEFGLEYLKKYRLVVIAGVQEYWTQPMVDHLEAYVQQGGNLYLSATEFAFGIIRFEQDRQAIQFYYDPRNDPLYAVSTDRVATFSASISNLEDFFGVSLEQGKGLGISDQFEPLTVVNPAHWAYGQTGFSAGEVLTPIRGLGVGAWVRRGEDGRYCIVSAAIPCEQVEVLAVASYPPLDTRFEEDIDIRLDGTLDYATATIPETTFAVVAVIRQGEGTLFVAPGVWWNSPHPNGYDSRIQTVIENVIRRLSQ